MDFQFVGVAGQPPAFLMVREGCYVRVSEIAVVGTGPISLDGEEQVSEKSVALTLVNSLVAYFDPCDDAAGAVSMAGELTSAIVKSEVLITPQPEA